MRLNFWMTVFALPALMILVGLGVWQLQRLEWKEALIAERTARLAMPPVRIADVPLDRWQEFELRRVVAQGRFLHDRSLEIQSRTLKGRPGVHIVTPFEVPEFGTVIVDRGWAPPARYRQEADLRRPAGTVELEGILRAGGPTSPWVPDNVPGEGTWYFADPPAMARALGLSAAAPFLIEAAAEPGAVGYPVGGQTITAVRNNHLQYALTWFGLAATLIAIYVLFHVRRR